MTTRATFRQADLERALRAAKAEGRAITAVVIDGAGFRLEEHEPPPPPPYRGPAVYFVRLAEFDLVKIGFSTNVCRRILDLEAGAGMGGALRELRRIPGDVRLERRFHLQFAEQRLFGEWFRFTGPIEDWLKDPAL